MSAVTVRVDAPGRRELLVVLEEELVVGRECDGLLVADPQVSRSHLRLRRVGPKVEVADLGSTNGTSLEGVPLTGARLIEGTSRVLIGDTMLTICVEPDRPTDPTAAGRATTLRVPDGRATSIGALADAVTLRSGDVPDDSLAGETMTIVFSDIEGSTERATGMGDEDWYALLEESPSHSGSSSRGSPNRRSCTRSCGTTGEPRAGAAVPGHAQMSRRGSSPGTKSAHSSAVSSRPTSSHTRSRQASGSSGTFTRRASTASQA